MVPLPKFNSCLNNIKDPLVFVFFHINTYLHVASHRKHESGFILEDNDSQNNCICKSHLALQLFFFCWSPMKSVSLLIRNAKGPIRCTHKRGTARKVILFNEFTPDDEIIWLGGYDRACALDAQRKTGNSSVRTSKKCRVHGCWCMLQHQCSWFIT